MKKIILAITVMIICAASAFPAFAVFENPPITDEAAKLENTLPESDKRMLGIWQSHTVTDVLGDPIEGFSGDKLKMEFAADHTAKVTFKGKDLESHKWSLVGDWGSLDGDELNINWDITDNGIDVNYSTDDDYFVFGCTKQS